MFAIFRLTSSKSAEEFIKLTYTKRSQILVSCYAFFKHNSYSYMLLPSNTTGVIIITNNVLYHRNSV